MSAEIGLECKLYVSSTPNNWEEVTNARDVTLMLETGEADASSRISEWEQILPALIKAAIDFELVWDTENGTFDLMQSAFLTRSSLYFAIMDGDINTPGSQGLMSSFSLLKFSRKEPLQNTVTADVTIKPAYGVTPEWLTVS